MNEQNRIPDQQNTHVKGNAWKDIQKNDVKNVNTLKVLTAINDNALMAKEAIEVTIKSVTNQEFADLLRQQISKYDDFIKRAQSIATNIGCVIEPKNKFGRNMAIMSIKMKLMVDSSMSNIAEMMLLGTTNGIVDLGKLIRHTPSVNKEALTLLKELLIYEEDKVELMKYHL